MPNNLPVIRQTEMIAIRQDGEREVVTFEDLGRALDVNPESLRQAFRRNRDQWNGDDTTDCNAVETWTVTVSSPNGLRDVRVFSFRGAARFARHTKSPRADALYNHMLDLLEAERNGRAVPAVRELSEVDKLAMVLGVKLPEIVNQMAVVEAKVEALALAAAPERISETIKSEIADFSERFMAEQNYIGACKAHVGRCVKHYVERSLQHVALDDTRRPRLAKESFRYAWDKIRTHAGVNAFAEVRTKGQVERAMDKIDELISLTGYTPSPRPVFDTALLQQRIVGLPE